MSREPARRGEAGRGNAGTVVSTFPALLALVPLAFLSCSDGREADPRGPADGARETTAASAGTSRTLGTEVGGMPSARGGSDAGGQGNGTGGGIPVTPGEGSVVASASPEPGPTTTPPRMETPSPTPPPSRSPEPEGVGSCPKEALFCDGFETYAGGTTPGGEWKAQTANGTAIRIDEAVRHGGGKSVRFDYATARSRAFLVYEKLATLPLGANAFFGRVMMRFKETPSAAVHWTNVEALGPLQGRAGVTGLYRFGGIFGSKWMFNYETYGARSDCWQNSARKAPAARWMCVEWQYDGTADRMRAWFDGVAQGDLNVDGKGQGCGGHDLDDKWIAPRFEKLALGWEAYQEGGGNSLWMDDLALGKVRLGCPGAP